MKNMKTWEPFETAPKENEEEILLLLDCAEVDIVRLAWFDEEDGLWWSYRNSCGKEAIDLEWFKPLGWLPFPPRPQ